MKESCVADPALLLDQLVVHDSEVGSRAAEADPSQLRPETQRFPEGRALRRSEPFIPRHAKPRGRSGDKTIAQTL
jgi:hypothetical protein